MYGDNGEWHEDPTITVSCSKHDHGHKPLIVLVSDGFAAEYNGALLGLYSLSGEHNKASKAPTGFSKGS